MLIWDQLLKFAWIVVWIALRDNGTFWPPMVKGKRRPCSSDSGHLGELKIERPEYLLLDFLAR